MNKKFKMIENYDVVNLQPTFSKQKSFYGKAKIIKADGANRLISYDTEIIEFDARGKRKMLCGPEALSNTTLKHLREFLRQFGYRDIAELTKKELLKELYKKEL